MSIRTAFVLAPLLAGCAFADSHFTVDYPTKQMPQGNELVSVFGVFKDGRMRTEAWQELSPRFAGVLGNKPCELAFGDRLRAEDEESYEHFDHEIKDNGITKDTLASFAARAEGKMILAITVLGEAQVATGLGNHTRGMEASATAAQRRMRARSLLPGDERPVAAGLDIAVALYSIEAKDNILTLDLHYTGTTLEEAYKRIAMKLEGIIPDARCVGWKWKPPQRESVGSEAGKSAD